MTDRARSTAGRHRDRVIRTAVWGGGLATVVFLGTSVALGLAGWRGGTGVWRDGAGMVGWRRGAAVGGHWGARAR